jgi:hypothetical protein
MTKSNPSIAVAIDAALQQWFKSTNSSLLPKGPWSQDLIDRMTCALAAADAARGRSQGSTRNALIQAWHIAKDGCLVPPDGGSPTEDEIAICDRIADGIAAMIPDCSLPVLAVPPEAKAPPPAWTAAKERVLRQLVYLQPRAPATDAERQLWSDLRRAAFSEGSDE